MWRVYVGLCINDKLDCPIEIPSLRAKTKKQAIEQLTMREGVRFDPIEQVVGAVMLKQAELLQGERAPLGALVINYKSVGKKANGRY